MKRIALSLQALRVIDGCDPDAPEILAESVTRLELATGSRIVSFPGTEGTSQGYAAANARVGKEAPAGRMSSEPTHAVFAIKERQHAGSVHSRKTGVELTHRRLSAPHDGGVLGQSHAEATGGGQDGSG